MRYVVAICAILIGGICGCAHAEGDRLQVWRSSYFDGSDFREGIALNKATVYRRDGFLPIVISGDETPPNDRLPKGTGALVIHCYVQSSGGKLLSHSGSQPVAGAAVELKDGGRKVLLRTDADGFALVALPVGDYEVSVQGMVRKVAVEKGKTLLLPIRVGKRMVD